MLPNNKITGSLAIKIFNKLELIVKDDATQDCLQSIRREEPTGTRLEPEPEMHVRIGDRNEMGTGLLLGVHIFTSTVRHSGGFC
jgi:hypothetical protein